MPFSFSSSLEILERTPDVLTAMLEDLSAEWTTVNEGGDSWSVYDIIGHLIHGEKTDWIPRMDIMLSNSVDKTFPPFDRFAQFEASKGKTLAQLLTEFRNLRQHNIEHLLLLKLTDEDLLATGNHPVFGEVRLSQLLATWTVHDLNHIAQISRVMARQYTHDVGPWIEFLSILKK